MMNDEQHELVARRTTLQSKDYAINNRSKTKRESSRVLDKL
jgi:hypothetical protein